MAEHSTLTAAQLHEPKGVAAATANKVYVSDGAASGAWSTLPIAGLAGLNNANLIYIQARLTDLSTGSIVYVPCPLAGDIVSVVSVLQGVIATTDATLRLLIAGTPVTDSGITIANAGSAAGDVDTAAPTAARTVTANSAIEVENLGTGTTAEDAEILIAVDVS